MKILTTIFPKTANNNYLGSKIAFYGLIPFLWIIIFLDYVFRLITTYLHPLTPEYYISRPPGGITNIYFLGYSIIMFLLSIRKRAKSL